MLHLIKLSVGSESLESLGCWQRQRLKADARLWHRTRMLPRRHEEIVSGGGSIFWVIRGQVLGRQRIVGFDRIIDVDGRPDTLVLLDETLVPVLPRPHRPFQGWRYLKAEEAPRDLADAGSGEAEMPTELLAELRTLGLL